MLVHALEKSVKIRTVFEAALDKHFFDGVVRVSQHFRRFLQSFSIDKVYWRHAHFMAKTFLKLDSLMHAMLLSCFKEMLWCRLLLMNSITWAKRL